MMTAAASDLRERAHIRKLKEIIVGYKCVNGHDRCDQMYPNKDCPYCEETPRQHLMARHAVLGER